VKPKVSLTAYTFKSNVKFLILVVTEYHIELASTPAFYLVSFEFKSQPLYRCSYCCQCGRSHCL